MRTSKKNLSETMIDRYYEEGRHIKTYETTNT